MPLDLANYEVKATEAVQAFWGNRAAALKKQEQAGKLDAGSRGAVTAGKNMDGFLVLIGDLVKANGLTHAQICLNKGVVTLPGYFRPTKQWDMVVMNNGRLVAVIEMKSQVGSFGNNFNNRTEEAIGSAVDLLTAFREGALGNHTKPFLGWLMLIEDCPASRTPVKDRSPHFPVFKEFSDCSYADRYNLLCQKLVKENLYTSAAFITSPRSTARTGKYVEFSELTSLKTFVTQLAGHFAAEAALQK
ncbi:MAG: PaeR7I family type II restriction endonuclease [Chthoniobacteraceae bacterium]